MVVLTDLVQKIIDVIVPYIIPAFMVGGLISLGLTSIDKKRERIGWRILYYAYWTLIVCETVVRRIGTYKVTNDHIGLWQLTQDPWYWVSTIENVLMFVPVGVFFVMSFHGDKGLRRLIAAAVIMTVIIELIQFIMRIGEAQLIDVVLACLGAWIGYAIVEGRFKNKNYTTPGSM